MLRSGGQEIKRLIGQNGWLKKIKLKAIMGGCWQERKI